MVTMAERDRLYKRHSNLKQDKYNNKDIDIYIHTSYVSYQSARNKLNTREFQIQQKLYKEILQSSDEEKLWKEMNWSGKHKGGKTNVVPIKCMADYFETLYQPIDKEEMIEMNNLETDTYIPVTDDPINHLEIESAAAKMKKGGYDLSLMF